MLGGVNIDQPGIDDGCLSRLLSQGHAHHAMRIVVEQNVQCRVTAQGSFLVSGLMIILYNVIISIRNGNRT